MIAWFNIGDCWGRRDNDFLEYCAKRKGKNIHFIDGETGSEVTEEEFDKLIDQTIIPSSFIIEQQEENTIYPVVVRKQKTKNKNIGRPRKPIPWRLRQEIKTRSQGRCYHCGKENADQNHHVDGNPSNNLEHNIELLCYDCHKVADAEIRKIKKLKRQSHR
jgi:hypothetical protein